MLKTLSEVKVSTCCLYFSLENAVQRAHLKFFKVSTPRLVSLYQKNRLRDFLNIFRREILMTWQGRQLQV